MATARSGNMTGRSGRLTGRSMTGRSQTQVLSQVFPYPFLITLSNIIYVVRCFVAWHGGMRFDVALRHPNLFICLPPSPSLPPYTILFIFFI